MKKLAKMSEKIAGGATKRLLKWLQRLTEIVAENMDNSWLDEVIMSVKLLLNINIQFFLE